MNLSNLEKDIHKNGSYVWTDVLSVKGLDPVTGESFFLTSIQDITELVEAEKALKASEERYELASAASDNGIWDWKVGTNEVYYSDQWKAQVGYLPDELENKFSTWENLLYPDDKERMVKSVQEFLANPTDYFIEEFRMVHKDGKPRWIKNRAAAVTDEKGNVTRMFGAHTDITLQKKAQDELRKTDKMYRGIIENATDGVVMIGFDKKFKFASSSALKMFGYSNEEIITAYPDELTHPDDLKTVLETLEDTAKNNNPNTIEYRFLGKDQKYIWIESTFSRSFDENGNPAIVINFRNIEERKENERLLLEAKKQAEDANIHKNYFLANMSHEIRTPMNGVIGFSELLKADNLSKNQRNKYLNIIDGNAKQLLNLIDDIIDVAKIEANELRVIKGNCNITAMIDELEANFNQMAISNGKTDIEFKSYYDNKFKNLEIVTDCSRLRQTLSNLLNNAMKFTEKGEISFGFKVENSNIIFNVKDHGIGIPSNKVKEIFERFKQVNYSDNAKFGGTGLGLAICKGIVKLLGGEISVTSELKKGTEFVFNIPLINAKNTSSSSENIKNIDKKLTGKTILIAEDDIIVQFYYEEITSDLNANILFAQDGAKAVEMYKEHPEIDLILLDIRMPKLNGFEVMDKIFAIDQKAKIIAQTAYASNNEKTMCINKGCLDYLTKPILKDVFMKTLEKWA